MGLIDNVNVQVNGSGDIVSTLQSYITKILKPNIVDGRNVLEQWMVSAENTKYVIKYDFTLNGGTIEMPKNCIIEIDGGSINNGTLVGDETVMLNANEVDGTLTDTELEGTWKDTDEAIINAIVKHKVYLTGSTLSQSMMSKENTIYVVKDDLTLSEDVTIPANCVLEFEGGSIGGNKTLTGANTGIEAGLVKIFSTDVTLAGSWNVCSFNAIWFGVSETTNDNGIFLNNLSYLKKITIPFGDYNVVTPVIFDNIERLNIDGNLHYKGIEKNTTFIKITNCSCAKIDIDGVIMNDSSVLDFSEEANSNQIGIDFNSCNACVLSFIRIMNFNTGLRVSDTKAKGCSYNTINLGTIEQANYHLRLYQENYNNNVSWVNQNLFVGGRFFNYSTFPSSYPSIKILICGPKYENPSATTDGYDHVDNLTFIGTSLEGKDLAFYIRRGRSIRIINTRLEGAKAIKCVSCEYGTIDFQPGLDSYYQNGAEIPATIDLSESGLTGLTEKSYRIVTSITPTNTDWTEIDTTSFKCFRFVSDSKTQGFYLKYLEDENGAIDEDSQPNYGIPYKMRFDSTAKSFITNTYVGMSPVYKLDERITKIAVKTWSSPGAMTRVNIYATREQYLY